MCTVDGYGLPDLKQSQGLEQTRIKSYQLRYCVEREGHGPNENQVEVAIKHEGQQINISTPLAGTPFYYC